MNLKFCAEGMLLSCDNTHMLYTLYPQSSFFLSPGSLAKPSSGCVVILAKILSVEAVWIYMEESSPWVSLVL